MLVLFAVYWLRAGSGIMACRMPLTHQEELLVDAVRRLPAGAAGELTALAERLAALAEHTEVDWSDAWSEEDLREYSAASASRPAEDLGDEAARGRATL